VILKNTRHHTLTSSRCIYSRCQTLWQSSRVHGITRNSSLQPLTTTPTNHPAQLSHRTTLPCPLSGGGTLHPTLRRCSPTLGYCAGQTDHSRCRWRLSLRCSMRSTATHSHRLSAIRSSQHPSVSRHQRPKAADKETVQLRARGMTRTRTLLPTW